MASAANSSNIEVRVYAVQALGAIGKAATNTIPLLVRLTRDEDGGVRMSAVASLGRIGIAAPEVVDALRRALSDPSGDVQLTSVHALDAIGQSASDRIPILAQLTRDENSAVRFDAVETLGRTGLGSPESVAAIKLALSDSDVGVRICCREGTENTPERSEMTAQSARRVDFSPSVSHPTFAPAAPRGRGRGQTVDWSGLRCEGRFWERKLGPAKAYYL